MASDLNIKNWTSYVVMVLCYFILSFSYAIRGELNFFGMTYQFQHHFMQFIVSTTYFTIAYIYIIDSSYDENKTTHFWENGEVINIVLVYILVVLLLTTFYILFKRKNALVN